MIQIWENSRKRSFGHNFGPFAQNLAQNFFFVIFTSTRSLTLVQATIVCTFKEN